MLDGQWIFVRSLTISAMNTPMLRYLWSALVLVLTFWYITCYIHQFFWPLIFLLWFRYHVFLNVRIRQESFNLVVRTEMLWLLSCRWIYFFYYLKYYEVCFLLICETCLKKSIQVVIFSPWSDGVIVIFCVYLTILRWCDWFYFLFFWWCDCAKHSHVMVLHVW